MKAVSIRSQPILPPIEKIVVEFSPEEARALYALSNFHGTVSGFIEDKVFGAGRLEPLRCVPRSVMEKTLLVLFHSLQPHVQAAFPGVKG